ncbi:AAA family ATPase [Flammeovirga sp. MY04]|uniref:AAA family ATPase n=1 Tax=Flammeovirga sp. MY04 TaxID=1191459 RepID=UPI0008061646|nr:AAA family ATPase [Flammeovirga sp. MY04]ANQ48064.1 AAA family ATPase [Flammeovirga sp. MY04]
MKPSLANQLIAIKVNKDCNPEYSKVLKREEIYYINKLIDIEDNRKVINEPIRLYDYKDSEGRTINVNISAIIGGNGSGKSTIFELVLCGLYVLSKDQNLLTETNDGQLNNLSIELFYTSDKYLIQLSIRGDKLKVHSAYRLSEDRQYFSKEMEDVKIDVNQFSYCIGVNYSLYGLNARHMGDWINSLFHKNDGYKTPANIIPHRTNGLININNENELAKERLLTNIFKSNNLDNSDFSIVSGKKINEIKFFVAENKEDKLQYYKTIIGNETLENQWNDILEDICKIWGTIPIGVTDLRIVDKYIIDKIIKVIKNYFSERQLIDDNLYPQNSKEIVEIINHDKTHITLKLRRALNFLKLYNNYYKELSDNSHPDRKGRNIIMQCELKRLREILHEYSNNKPLSDLLLPSVIDFDLNIFVDNKGISEFSDLSSGEKQYIYSINSLLYHAQNINSVHNPTKRNNIIKYNSITYFLDEIELYFHPEIQRTYINDLLSSFEDSPLNKVKNINFIFISHSPYILSDIPNQYVTRLKNGVETKFDETGKNTFGSNIHEMLSNDFFMENGTIGEFAKRQIEDIALFHEKVINSDTPKIYSKDFEIKKEKFFKTLNIIGDEIIKGLIKYQLETIEEKLIDTNSLENRIERLKEEIRVLEQQKKNDKN